MRPINAFQFVKLYDGTKDNLFKIIYQNFSGLSNLKSA